MTFGIAFDRPDRLSRLRAFTSQHAQISYETGTRNRERKQPCLQGNKVSKNSRAQHGTIQRTGL